MANSIARFSGESPRGETEIMSKITVTTAGLLNLAGITTSEVHTLRLWAKASAARTATAYMGGAAYTMAITTGWKEFKYTTAIAAGNTCELYLPAGTYYIWHPKLERSNKASDYTQAPEDVQENINTAANNAITAANAFTTEALKEYSTTTEMWSEIKQTQSQIKLSVNEQITETKTYAVTQAGEALSAAKADTDTKLKSYATITQMNSAISMSASNITLEVSKKYTTLEYTNEKLSNYSTTTEMRSVIDQKADSITSTVSKTYATISTVNGIATRVTKAESSITQNADSITAAVKRLTTAESSIKLNADNITAAVTRIGKAESSIKQNADSITSAVSRIGKAETKITQNADSITLAVNRLTTAESKIQQNATSISSAVSRIGTAESKITQTADKVTSLTSTVNGHTSSITQNANAIRLRVETSKLVSEINASSGTISMKSNRFTVESTNFTLTANGTLTAKNANFTNATITGTISTTSGNLQTYIHDGTIESFFKNKRVMRAQIVSSSYANQYAILGSGNYDGIAIGAVYDNGIYTYYRCNIQGAESYEGCRHRFVGNVKFTDGRFQSNTNFEDGYGVAFGGNSAFRYISGTGIYCGIAGTYACDLHLRGSNVVLDTKLSMGNHYLDFNSNFGITWGGNIGIRYYNGGDPWGLWVGIGDCPTVLTGTQIRCKAPLYRNTGDLITSDKRQKESISAFDSRYTKLFDRLEAKTFRYKNFQKDKTNFGFIAQEVTEALIQAGYDPDVMSIVDDVNKDGSEYALDYTQLIPLMWEMIKDLRRKLS